MVTSIFTLLLHTSVHVCITCDHAQFTISPIQIISVSDLQMYTTFKCRCACVYTCMCMRLHKTNVFLNKYKRTFTSNTIQELLS